MAKVIIDTRVASIPTSAAPCRFCAVAMIVEPTIVRVRNRCSASMSTSAATTMRMRCAGNTRPATRTMPANGGWMRWKSAPQIACTPASKNRSRPIAAIMSCSGGALRSGSNTSRSVSTATSAVTIAAPSIASQKLAP